VSRFIAHDGTEFKTKEELEEYIADHIRTYMDKKTKHLLKGLITAREQMDFILSIIGSFEDVKRLRNLLNKYFK
jgi:hypothetical protein